MENTKSYIQACADVADASHILFDQGILDGFGHVSMRHPDFSDRFLISRNRAPALVQPEDVLTLDFDGEVIGEDDRRSFLERFIHAEIYRTRDDVMGVVHAHAASVLPFTIVEGLEFSPVCHMSGFIKPQTPVYEIRDHAGEASDMLIRTQGLGVSLANCLGDHALVLMRGHGITVVGNSIRQAVFRAVYAEVNARIQKEAMGMGKVKSLNPAEAMAADATNTSQIGRAWTFWKQCADARVAALTAAEKASMHGDGSTVG